MIEGRDVELVTIPDAAKRLSIGRKQVKRAVEDGELPVYDFGGWPRLKWAEVMGWVESKRRVGTETPLRMCPPSDLPEKRWPSLEGR